MSTSDIPETPSPSTSRQRVIVVGAGAAGLAAARRLLAVGIQPLVLEAGTHVAGLWQYENDNGASVAYESLHVNSETSATAYPGFPFPDGSPMWPDHRLVARYLNEFANAYGIRRCIQFNSRVHRVDRTSDGLWRVESATGAYTAGHLIIATGHQAAPAHPEEVRQNFAGEYLHVADYRTPQSFIGKRVLVIGLGNSGVDVASDLVPFAASVHNAVRSPVLVMPRMIFGVPTSRTLGKFNRPWVPWLVQRQIQRGIARFYHGPMEKWGLRTPKTKTHPATSLTYMPAVAYGRIVILPGIESVDEKTVTFVDGREVEFDAIVAATGYDIDLTFMGEYAPVVERRLETYKRILHPGWDGLYFVGFFNANGAANISLMDVQAEYVAALITGRTQRPTREAMLRDIAREEAFIAKTFPHAARYGLELAPKRYRKQMSQLLAGVEVPPPTPTAPRREGTVV